MKPWVQQFMNVKALDECPDKAGTFAKLIHEIPFDKIEDREARQIVSAVSYLGTLLAQSPTQLFVSQTDQQMQVIRSLYADMMNQGDRQQVQFERAADHLLELKKKMKDLT